MNHIILSMTYQEILVGLPHKRLPVFWEASNTQLMGSHRVLFRELDSILKWTIVRCLLFTQPETSKPVSWNNDGWRDQFSPCSPAQSCIEILILIRILYRSWQKIVQFNSIDSKLGYSHSLLLHFAGWECWNSQSKSGFYSEWTWLKLLCAEPDNYKRANQVLTR